VSIYNSRTTPDHGARRGFSTASLSILDDHRKAGKTENGEFKFKVQHHKKAADMTGDLVM
jgi:hypothetical protein